MRTWREPDIEPADNTKPTPATANPATAAGPLPTGNTKPTPATASPATGSLAKAADTLLAKPTPASKATSVLADNITLVWDELDDGAMYKVKGLVTS